MLEVFFHQTKHLLHIFVDGSDQLIDRSVNTGDIGIAFLEQLLDYTLNFQVNENVVTNKPRKCTQVNVIL